jgi:hypothetical protein
MATAKAERNNFSQLLQKAIKLKLRHEAAHFNFVNGYTIS